MAKILFIMDTEEGHILPSFGLAHALKKRNHEIYYLTIVDNTELVTGQGFNMIPILENIYYKGYKERYRKLSPPPGTTSLSETLLSDYNAHLSQLMNGKYDSVLQTLQADIVIVSAFLRLDTLILYYKYRISPVIFTPFLRRPDSTPAKDCFNYLNGSLADEILPLVEFILNLGWNIDSLTELVKPLDLFHELIACPYELEISSSALREQVHYIEPSIRTESIDQNLRVLYKIPAQKKIIYGSMGSQPVRHGAVCDLFFGKIIDSMRGEDLQDAHLVLSVGPEYPIEKLEPVPPNVTIARWVSQIAILKIASLAVFHGGLGSVKECIYYGVPMIIFPLGYDQPDNAYRIRVHNLGMDGDIEAITGPELRSNILQVMNSDTVRNNIQRMQQVFREREASNPGADIIEAILDKKPVTRMYSQHIVS